MLENTHNARQDGSEPHVTTVRGVTDAVYELVWRTYVVLDSFQHIHTVRVRGNVCNKRCYIIDTIE